MTKYGKAMVPSTRRPPIGAAWIIFAAATLATIALGVFASLSTGDDSDTLLWALAQGTAVVAIASWYALAIHWGRRRKRLWG